MWRMKKAENREFTSSWKCTSSDWSETCVFPRLGNCLERLHHEQALGWEAPPGTLWAGGWGAAGWGAGHSLCRKARGAGSSPVADPPEWRLSRKSKFLIMLKIYKNPKDYGLFLLGIPQHWKRPDDWQQALQIQERPSVPMCSSCSVSAQVFLVEICGGF